MGEEVWESCVQYAHIYLIYTRVCACVCMHMSMHAGTHVRVHTHTHDFARLNTTNSSKQIKHHLLGEVLYDLLHRLLIEPFNRSQGFPYLSRYPLPL